MQNKFGALTINAELASSLIAEQFPQYKTLTVTPMETSGWDNRAFHLGENLLTSWPRPSLGMG